MKEKVLIIKIGFTEFLTSKTEDIISMGDVIRTTPILHNFKDAQVSWLTDKSCYPFLEGIPYIHRLMHYDLNTVLQLQAEYFDTVINLEKAGGLCAFTDSIKAWKKYGFRFNPISGEVAAYLQAENVLEVSSNHHLKQQSHKTFNDFLFEILGKRWNGEEYLLGYKPKSSETFDLGFNIHVGAKWPNKAWPMEYWKKLEDICRQKYSISYQQGVGNVYEYMDWLNSCRMIITNDSLGLHLAIAMKKKVAALFGPSFASEVYLGDSGASLIPEVSYDCMPCMNPDCVQDKRCMYFIAPEKVAEKIDSLMQR